MVLVELDSRTNRRLREETSVVLDQEIDAVSDRLSDGPYAGRGGGQTLGRQGAVLIAEGVEFERGEPLPHHPSGLRRELLGVDAIGIPAVRVGPERSMGRSAKEAVDRGARLFSQKVVDGNVHRAQRGGSLHRPGTIERVPTEFRETLS